MNYDLLMRDSMDLLFDIIDHLLISGRMDAVDDLLKHIMVPETPELAVGIITVTFPAKHHLPSRAEYVSKVEVMLLEKVGPKRTENILKGLK